MATKKDGSMFDINSLFEQELSARNEDLRRQAAAYRGDCTEARASETQPDFR